MSNRNYQFRNNKEGKRIFSFSKLMTFETCPYSYYLQYIKHIKGKDSIYGIMGEQCHISAQDLVEGKINNDEALERFETALEDSIDVLGLKFPTEKSGDNFKECMSEFLEHYKPHHDKYDIEKGFDVVMRDGKTLILGFIDLIIYNEDGTIDVVDYKTSSKFSKKDFQHKKMQLLIYAKSLLEEGYKINRLYFNMMKYCTISWDEINSKKQLVHKSTMSERNGIGLKLKSVAKRLLKKQGLDENDIELRVDRMIETNTIDDLIADKFTISDYKVDVELSEESLEEMEQWVESIVNKTEELGKDEDNFKPIEIKKGSDFFCQNLCGKGCKYFKEYSENDSNSYKNRKKKEKEEDDELDDLL